MTKHKLKCAAALFLLGGAGYVLLEKCWRGHSHWTMFLLGGGCFHLIGAVATHCKKWHLAARCALCSLLITAAEFLCGCVVNLRFRMNVWNYSRCPHNLLGQVCLPFSLLWGLLSAAAMPLYVACRRWLLRL